MKLLLSSVENIKMEFTKENATKFFAHLFGGEHHIPRGGLKEFGDGWCVNYMGDLSTFDYNILSKLVIMAHDCAVRVSLRQGGPRAIKICIWQREREGSFDRRHPTIEYHVEEFRAHYSDDFKTLLK